MPYKSEKIKIEGTKHDRRRKLTDADKEEIKSNPLGLSQRKLALMYGVSRRTIQFTLDPQKLEENKKRRAERGGSKKYYDKDAHKESMKEHRKYKHELYKSKKIKH